MKKKQCLIIAGFLFASIGMAPKIAAAQEKKVAPTSQQLYQTVARLDSTLFAAFNRRDMAAFKPMFTEDLEWFQDNGGLLSYQTVFENFATNFNREYTLTRTLVPGSLEVHPIKGYGAIEIGAHQFHHIENGKPEIGTFKFLMIWKETPQGWKISRVVSYDH
jgi:ketosteroid isomerase-like protein